jgi:hypothetical protein
MADLQSNISSFIPSNINNTISNIQNPQAFGQQIIDNVKQKVVGSVLDIVTRLKNEIERTVLRKIQLEKTHIENLYKLALDKLPKTSYEFGRVIETPPLLTEEEYQQAVIQENERYEAEKRIVDNLLVTLEARLKKIVEDKIGPAVKQFLEFKAQVAGAKINRETLKRLYESEKVQQLKRNIFKTLAVVAGSIVIQEIVKLIANNAELQNLVNRTNTIISEAVTLPQLNQARVARNGCISKINQQQSRINALLKILNTLNVILTVFGVLVALLNLIPGFPAPIAKKLTILWANAKKVRDSIGAILSILIPMLQSAIAILENLKRQLLEINERIESKTLLLLTDDELNSYLDQIRNSSEDPLCDTNRFPGEIDQDYYNRLRRSTCIQEQLAKRNPTADINNINDNGLLQLANEITPPTANNFGTYKGFRFIIKQENDSKFVVRGNKRNYAVAINTREVEQIKSDFSFTLNPQQLVDQLKFIIDQQNLQG